MLFDRLRREEREAVVCSAGNLPSMYNIKLLRDYKQRKGLRGAQELLSLINALSLRYSLRLERLTD